MTVLKRIDEIEVENVRGSEAAKYRSLDILPNIPTLVVAPNGFGKSSLATAFASMNRNRLELHKDHYHRGDENRKPKLRISYTLSDAANTSESKEADTQSNSIGSLFDVFVINSQLVSRARQVKFSGKTVVTSDIEVSSFTLIASVPEQSTIAYSYTAGKQTFGKNGKVLPNVSPLLKNRPFIRDLYQEIDLSKHLQVGVQTAVSGLIAALNHGTGNSNSILSAVPSAALGSVKAIKHLEAIAEMIQRFKVSFGTEIEDYLAAIEIANACTADKVQFRKAAAFYEYEDEKAAYIQLFSSMRETWKNIRPQEDQKQGLVLKLPKANQISNGERDIICFVAMLKQAELKLKKQSCILIIDEIFDYLDDANLVACQFYLTKLIATFKQEGRQLFPIILTHLSPGLFKNFYFKNLKIRYLDQAINSDKIDKIILQRSDGVLKDELSKYFLHFDPGSIDLTTEFSARGWPTELADSEMFAAHVKDELDRYLAGKNYDPLSVCCALRLEVEKKVFETLVVLDQPGFLDTFKTVDKLKYAEERGASVPEIFFLLAIIYNQAMHSTEKQDVFSPLHSKLQNLTIKSMIRQAISL